jgi:hypothetical protein
MVVEAAAVITIIMVVVLAALVHHHHQSSRGSHHYLATAIVNLTINNKLQIGHERKPSQLASRESYTPWPMRDVKDNAIYRKSSK